jgi:anaphase-promoting complex subunit 3
VRVRELSPACVEGMHFYSTVLWHLKREKELSALAQDLLRTDVSSPIVWCALGNSFSLKRAHEEAIKAFSRATELQQDFAYAHVLCGHEYLANDAADKAVARFRVALQLDSRLYSAW